MSDLIATTAVDVKDPATGHVWHMHRARLCCKLCGEVKYPFGMNTQCSGSPPYMRYRGLRDE